MVGVGCPKIKLLDYNGDFVAIGCVKKETNRTEQLLSASEFSRSTATMQQGHADADVNSFEECMTAFLLVMCSLNAIKSDAASDVSAILDLSAAQNGNQTDEHRGILKETKAAKNDLEYNLVKHTGEVLIMIDAHMSSGQVDEHDRARLMYKLKEAWSDITALLPPLWDLQKRARESLSFDNNGCITATNGFNDTARRHGVCRGYLVNT